LPNQKVSWTALTKELHEVDLDFEPRLDRAIDFYKEGESRDAIMKAVERGMACGTPWDLEVEIITAKGNERWVRAVGGGEMVDGKCVRLFGTFQDIHERKSSEVILHEAYAEKARILESIGDAFFAADKNWVVTYWNKHAEELLGTRRDEIIGKNLWDLYPDAVPLAFYGQYHKAMHDRVTTHFEEYYAPLKLWCHVSAYPSASGLSVYFRDVTKQKQSMEELAEQNEKLKEIAWIQSHGLRAPIARMLGLIHIIDEGMDMKGELPELLAQIKMSAFELDGIVRKIVRKTEVTSGPGATTGPHPFDWKLLTGT
jgi:PAS domain S-box-containing protein